MNAWTHLRKHRDDWRSVRTCGGNSGKPGDTWEHLEKSTDIAEKFWKTWRSLGASGKIWKRRRKFGRKFGRLR